MKQKGNRYVVLVGLMAGLSFLALTSVQADWPNWWRTPIEGSGHIVKQERQLKNFRQVQINLPAKVELRQGEQEAVILETDDNIAAQLETLVEGDALVIRMRDKDALPKTRQLKLTILLKNLDELVLDSSGSVSSEAIRSRDLKLRVGGSGEVVFKDLQADSLKVSIGGSGQFSARGSVDQLAAAIGGSGRINLRHLGARDVRINIGGSGQVTTWASENLTVNIGGSGQVDYYGDPRVSKSIGGSGSVRRRGAGGE